MEGPRKPFLQMSLSTTFWGQYSLELVVGYLPWRVVFSFFLGVCCITRAESVRLFVGGWMALAVVRPVEWTGSRRSGCIEALRKKVEPPWHMSSQVLRLVFLRALCCSRCLGWTGVENGSQKTERRKKLKRRKFHVVHALYK